MSYNIKLIPDFVKELKQLSKKYPSLKSDFATLLKSIENDPTQGTSIGGNCYKIRMAITSKGKGKSGGARIITYIKFVKNTIFLIAIFDKSEKENLPDKEIAELIGVANRS